MSKGNSIQITESIKLFKAVVSYQSFVAEGNFNIHADLLHVRGPVLRNSVTKTIYHNYLGLYYNKKAMHLLKEISHTESTDILSIRGLRCIASRIDTFPPSTVEEIVMYLRSACDQFDRAHEISSEDVMWPGFINYNKSRTLYFLGMLSESHESWLSVMNNAIESRYRLNRLIDEVLTESRAGKTEVTDTHLKQFFMYQEELARVMKLNLLISKANAKESSAPLLYRGTNIETISRKDIEKLLVNIDCFPLIKIYQDQVLEAMSV
mgnify:FL=1